MLYPDTDAYGNVILINNTDADDNDGDGGVNCDVGGGDIYDVDGGSNDDEGGSDGDESLPRLIVECVPPRSSKTNHPPSYYLSKPLYLLLSDQSIRGILWLEGRPITVKYILHVDKL